MFKTNIKKLFLTLLITSLLILIGNSTTVTQAKFSPVTRKICSLAIAPYNLLSAAISDSEADQYLNYLSNETCNQFVKLYGNAYNPQPPKAEDNPVKAGSENKNVPIIRHDHAYFNDTIEDENFYYKSFVDRFIITLQSDGFNSIDLDKIKCQTPYPANYDKSKIAPLEDCSGTLDDAKFWGGTTVTKNIVGNTVVITWDFGSTNQNGEFKGRPQIWANNGKNFDQAPNLDLTDENNRKLEFNVHLPTKDNGKIWSTTTTSRVLLADLAINKANYSTHKGDGCFDNKVNDPKSGWCYMDPKTNGPTKNFATETVFTSADKTFYWFDIGSVATVWKKATPQNVCTELTATLDDKNPIKINGKDAYPMSVNSITFAPTNILPEGAELKWSTTDPNGQFWTYENITALPTAPKKAALLNELNGNWVNTSAHQNKTIYYLGLPESKITVTLDKIPADQNNPLCKTSMTSPVAPECLEILVDHQEPIYEGTYSVFKAKSLDTDYKDLNSKITYTVDDGYGEFFLIKPSDYEAKKNKSKLVFEATPTSQTTPLNPTANFTTDFKLDPKIIIFGNNADQMATSWMNINTKIATGKFGIQDLSININDLTNLSNAIDKELIFLPEWMTSGLPPSTNPVDPFMNPLSDQTYDSNPGKYGLNSVFLAYAGANPPGATDDSSSNKGYTKSALFSTTGPVAPGTDVYFYAKKSGTNVIHVKTQGSTNPNCKKDYDIEPKPQLICKELGFQTNTKGDLVTGEPSLISISPKDTNGKKLPLTTKFKIATTTNGKFQTVDQNYQPSGKDLGNTALLSDFPISLVGATTAGNVTVTMDPTDPAYAAACAGSTNVVTPAVGVCTDLVTKFNGNIITQLEKNTNYVITETIVTTSKDSQKVYYKVNPDYGFFIDMSNPFAPTEKTEVIVNNVRTYPLILKIKNTIPTVTGLIPDVLQSQVVGSTAAACKESIPFNNPVPTQTNLCTQITVTPNQESFKTSVESPTPTTFTISGEYKYLEKLIVNIGSSITGNGTPKIFKNNEPLTNELTFNKADLQNNSLQFKYDRGTFTMNNDSLNINIKGYNLDGTENTQCKYPIYYPKSTPPTCAQTNNCPPGPEFCTLYPNDIKCKNNNTDTPPTFEKFVYAEDQLGKAATTININKKTNYVTYMLILKSGNNIKEAIVKDLSLKNGRIANTKVGAEESLTFEAMQIELIKGSSKKILFATDKYKDNKKDTGKFSEFSDENFTKTKYADYLCVTENKDKNLPCIDANSTDKISSTFTANGTLNFKQLNNLSFTDKIIVKYQMKYPTNDRISDEKCKTLVAKGGCGQEFKNKAEVKVTQNAGNPYNIKEVSTKVIAICPYILSRQGGDVFFHDLIKTGVDVNKCYDVKSCDGPCIKPKPPKKQKEADTGTTTTVEVSLLQSPTHDVCNLSNNAAGAKDADGEDITSGLEDYQDVLENFSSSICELEADISKAWTKQNITDSINANVKRLSRFGSNLSSISTITSPASLPADQSGVFIKTNGDLTIDNNNNNNNEYTISSSTNGIPAAQTYIVIGHDLHIKSNIKYEDSLLGITGFYNNKKIPAAAFIVIGGNIIIDNNVRNIDGILMAVDINGRGGEVKSTENTPTYDIPLNINGSLIGNVVNLFTNRQYAGDPLQDDGSVNIHYDERILLNPPPGINELINLQQVVVPN